MAYIGNTAQNQAFTPRVDYFSGNASATAFTLSFPVASVAQVQAVIENVPQNPSDAYTVSGNTITFTSAPPSGTNNIYVYYTSPITQVIQPGQGTVGTAQIVDGAVTQAKLAAGAGSQWVTSGANISYTNGSVGIGTSSPARKLQVHESSAGTNAYIQLSNAATGATSTDGFQLIVGTGGETILAQRENAEMQFWTNNIERMRINANGSVVIRNNIASNNALELGNTNTGTGTSFGVKFGGGTNASDYCISGDNAAGTVNLFNFRGNGDLQFNSGYGSAATAYGCRAWVTYNGGNAVIFASGGVSSVTKNGPGDWTASFSFTMPDANYAVAGFVKPTSAQSDYSRSRSVQGRHDTAPTTTSCRFSTVTSGAGQEDNDNTRVIFIR